MAGSKSLDVTGAVVQNAYRLCAKCTFDMNLPVAIRAGSVSVGAASSRIGAALRQRLSGQRRQC